MNEVEQIKKLAGITPANSANMQPYDPGSNISVTGTEKAELQRKHNIRPGTDEWFRLWFTLPFLTNTTPFD